MQEKVKQLSFRVKELSIENESLKAEVEIYRQEAGGKSGGADVASSIDYVDTSEQRQALVACEDFVRGGSGVYPKVADIVLPNLHGNANPLCCSLSSDDTVLATGGADCTLGLTPWGAACDKNKVADVVANACKLQCDGPVITTAFHPSAKVVAAGCMDGSVWVASFDIVTGKGLVITASTMIPKKHAKYVKTVAWRSTNNTPFVLASGSADGTIQLTEVSIQVNYGTDDETTTSIDLKPMETLHLSGAVEALCFIQDELCCYARGKPYLMCFDTRQDFCQRKINLNSGGRPAAAGTTLEDQHVSFAIMDMAPSPTAAGNNPTVGKYLAVATDASRNIIIDFASGLQVRNLYGHQNDSYSNPKIAWSSNGQYLLGNTQEDASVCVWDIASGEIVERMNEHGQTVRGLFASYTTDTLLTTSFDKQTKLWFSS